MHYATQEWSDFVRGVSPEPTAALMQRHLSSGCPSCNRAANLLRKLVLPAAEPEVEVPAFVVRKAKAIFNIPRKRLVARIVFDSFLQPLPAGVRSRNQMFRQAMFEAGSVLVDVRLQDQQDGKILITGQVADKASPNAPAGRVTLHLVSGTDRQPLKANRFGEFQTVYDPTRDSSLQISGSGRDIQVPLFQVAGPSSHEPVTALDFTLNP
jgi:hypothetical protein